MRRYPYHAYGRGEEVRAAVAKHGGEPLLMARIADLEKEIERLRAELAESSHNSQRYTWLKQKAWKDDGDGGDLGCWRWRFRRK